MQGKLQGICKTLPSNINFYLYSYNNKTINFLPFYYYCLTSKQLVRTLQRDKQHISFSKFTITIKTIICQPQKQPQNQLLPVLIIWFTNPNWIIYFCKVQGVCKGYAKQVTKGVYQSGYKRYAWGMQGKLQGICKTLPSNYYNINTLYQLQQQ